MKVIGVIAAALALALPASVAAARLPTSKESRAIHAAVASYVDDGDIDISTLRYERTRIGTVVKGWARTGVFAKGRNPQDVLLRFRGGRWRVVFLGSSDIGCGRPVAVRVDLWLECNGRLP